jgi:hypothetical protein
MDKHDSFHAKTLEKKMNDAKPIISMFIPVFVLFSRNHPKAAGHDQCFSEAREREGGQ